MVTRARAQASTSIAPEPAASPFFGPRDLAGPLPASVWIRRMRRSQRRPSSAGVRLLKSQSKRNSGERRTYVVGANLSHIDWRAACDANDQAALALLGLS